MSSITAPEQAAWVNASMATSPSSNERASGAIAASVTPHLPLVPGAPTPAAYESPAAIQRTGVGGDFDVTGDSAPPRLLPEHDALSTTASTTAVIRRALLEVMARAWDRASTPADSSLSRGGGCRRACGRRRRTAPFDRARSRRRGGTSRPAPARG